MAEVPHVYNHDVAGIHRRINRFILELDHSASAGTSQVSAHDQERLGAYLGAITSYVDWVVAQPQLDLPETHPRQHLLDANPNPSNGENESVRDLITLLEITRDEVVNGQSARHAAGLISFDEQRLRAVVAKAEAFLENYIQTVTPLDLPETSPMRAMVNPGKGGV